jgi:hypothetical protein
MTGVYGGVVAGIKYVAPTAKQFFALFTTSVSNKINFS